MKKEPLFRIGEMARLNHVSTQTLRLYSKNKLLEPEHVDPQTGYRYYTLSQCAKLDLIQALKSCRLPLEKIRALFQLSSREALLDVLDEQTQALADEIYHLSVSRNNLLRVQKNLWAMQSLPPFGQVFFELMPERRVDVQYTRFDFFAQGYEGYENMLRHMQNYLHEQQLPPSYFINVGTIMEQAHFEAGKFTAHAAFIFVDELYPETPGVRTLPQGTYMALCSDNTAREAEYARELYAQMRQFGMVPAGDYICEVLAQMPLHGAENLVYKIQVPVRRE